MMAIFAQVPPQPISPPVHYSAADFLIAYLAIAVVMAAVILILRHTNKELAKPQVIIVAVVLAMFCLPVSIIYLVWVHHDTKNNKT